MTTPLMKENELSLFGKVLVFAGIACVTIVALANISRGDVRNPFAFAIVGIGFGLFLVAKLSVVTRKQWISFGTKPMSPGMGNAYRAGYWLMAVGILATFL